MEVSSGTETCLGDGFKYCSTDLCVPLYENCPCPDKSEFQCSDGTCFPGDYKCDGIDQCLFGEDERQCFAMNEALTATNEEGVSVSAVVTITSLCVFCCVIVLIVLVFFLARRQKANTSRESTSASEPLRKCYITSDMEASADDRDVSERRATTFYQKCNTTDDSGHQDGKSPTADQAHRTSNGPKVYPATATTVRSCDNRVQDGVDRQNDLDPSERSPEHEGVGKYIFRPRLKYTNCNQLLDIDKKEREKLYVINSYKHCSGKSILPTTLTFDKDPEQFSSKFASEFLCASTPRQTAKQLSSNDALSISIDSIEVDF